MTVPHLLKLDIWLTGWRGMHMVSKEELLKYNISTYVTLSQSICDRLCIDRNCNMEVWFSALHHYEMNGFLQKHNNCMTYEYPFGPSVVREDFQKDSFGDALSQYTPKLETTRITCENGRYTMLMTTSAVSW
jgi:hypothetical protein